MIFAVILFYCRGCFVLRAVWSVCRATRIVHGHDEKIAARPCKESRTAEDGRKQVFRIFRVCHTSFEELVCARITRYSRSVFFVDLGVTQAILTNNKFLFYFIDATFFVVTYRCL